MQSKKIQKPTESELEILQILWSEDAQTVRQINEKMNKKREVGYTTTLKLMQIMTEKGFLKREKQGRGHVYKPKLKEEDTKKALLNRFLDTAFGGSASSLVMQLLGNSSTSREEIDEIKKLISDYERGKK